ncbi:hypothetical protein SAMN05216388_101322 [Halorientalis persicus]|uniref:RecA-superfamily ATPase, KaiC/GvpD/RAD55 family n=1 Tax=Halorientalis persicus TaxID=1367881 RepID=A0A1H8Q153_9EURY|nr:hypothetical protein [Halorientalis persicus]SEO47667.1 hypothetical protein SAMN05216388_101322 [Halorientalis persicus]
MDSVPESDSEHDRRETLTFPEALTDGATVLLCGFDPTEYALGLRCLAQFGSTDDSAIVVTTNQGVSETSDTFSSLTGSAQGASIGVVDMVSEGQSISAAYGEVPTVYTPSQGDTERLVIGLSDLTTKIPAGGNRHLVVRSLSPMLSATSRANVSDVVERISGLRTPDGLAVFGLDYTAHDEETVTAIAETADRVLWITEQPDGGFEMDLRSTRADFGQLTGE